MSLLNDKTWLMEQALPLPKQRVEKMYAGLRKVISGGQTGADQAGLIAAAKMKIPTGGTAPANWMTQAGPNPLLEVLGLKAEGTLRTRTIKNITDSVGTVLLTVSPNSPGSVLTRNECKRQGKPILEIDLVPVLEGLQKGGGQDFANLVQKESAKVTQWMITEGVTVLNVAGNRERGEALMTTTAVTTILTNAFKALDNVDAIVREFA
jgi:hypothetical protein